MIGYWFLMIATYKSFINDPIVTKTIIVGMDGTSMLYVPENWEKTEIT